jgi:putative Holliday junction resolvase
MPQGTTAVAFLGFDYGQKLIGVAVGGSHSRLAEPLATVAATKAGPDWGHIARLIQEWRPAALVVGLPLNMDGTSNVMTRAARRFGGELEARYHLPLHWVDERLSTRSAKQSLYEAGIPGTRHKRRLDKLAAQTILQAFLNDHMPRPDGDSDR